VLIRVAVDAEGTVYSWDVATSRLAATVTPAAGAEDCSGYCVLSPDGALLAIGASDGSTSVFSVATGRAVATLSDPYHIGVASIAFSPDSRLLAVADQNGNISVWDVG
jgi:WD40 repeat protein